MSTEAKILQKCEELDERLVQAAAGIKVLSTVGWPAEVMRDFLGHWRQKRRRLPVVTQKSVKLRAVLDELKDVMCLLDHQHPIGRYLYMTAHSYWSAGRMLESLGTPAFLELSKHIYGSHDSEIVRGGAANLQLADDFIQLTGDLHASLPEDESAHCLTPQYVAEVIRTEANKLFTNHRIEVVVDPHLAAKAAAGAQRVRIRGQTAFARHDVDQLLQHELLVHTATTLNGRVQPHIKSLGLGAPRTTCTQEGLATFAELITASMDLSRLRRLALRIKAVGLAAAGADFIDVFEFFLANGQSEDESFQSAARIFRGGNVKGGVYFTKDIVYLKGLFSVHSFLRKAIEARKIEYPGYLFVGRLTLGDVVHLEPYIRSGYISPAFYRPDWVNNQNKLAAYLSYALLANRLNLSQITLQSFADDLFAEDRDEDLVN